MTAARRVEAARGETAEETVPAVASALRTIETERDGLACLMAAIGNGLGAPFAAAVERIATAKGRAILTGMGKSGHVGRKIAATLASTGTPALYVHPAEASHGDLGMIQPEDVVVALSWSGETTELADIIGYARRYRVGLVAITANAASTLGREADICLTLPKAREACPNGLAPTTSTAMQLALGDALAVALLEARGFSAREFGIYHPGGRLGASLRQVREVMHGGAQMPIVPLGTPMRAAIAEIDAKGFGSVMVVDGEGRLAGIVTDGDIRRNIFRGDIERLAVEAVMSGQPRTVGPETLLAKALEIQESLKITALIVVEDGRPIGLVHYHDLLRSGVA
ncbi:MULTISPECIES: KpsF/GutQ family sugar-phosphate isomerase [Methylobacterium]|uniref:Arabinose 5-phosphate isomerase KdsD n=2 Tax=Pseudomonadota TaxID=1224 RepID=A0ABQ4T110_9HYPH|nr:MULTISPECIES: KpsF/GutQ family sugar-phosphate isomerase [Methylobacterium]PIU06029.1 MAG: KpsF/GutQ family sugar-phosphate isomerase [Methylobacterium sp. CG09_land_8_20_14_0_10_71_15]PIU11770.1 MAG: KpsF/GutQ family sugar-phosphate isomerase [Methylobacterium sp. CG08_land_8_20_14_0_20_71_15]GBU16303.1 D-arabinose 5-phosphate isomerase [Methylobacterium sp.]GJE07566.1 Arabinose 5-phosphate isomerase KdsD [Methylobacterium jeotgali]